MRMVMPTTKPSGPSTSPWGCEEVSVGALPPCRGALEGGGAASLGGARCQHVPRVPLCPPTPLQA